VAVASAELYASLHLTPDKQPCQHPNTQFLQARSASCHPTNSIKALKAVLKKQQNNINRSNINKTVNSTMQIPNIWEQ